MQKAKSHYAIDQTETESAMSAFEYVCCMHAENECEMYNENDDDGNET